MTTILSLDPGATTGWALIRDTKLLACGKAKFSDMPAVVQKHSAPGVVVVVEFPVIYPYGKAKAPHNDIVKLAGRASELAGLSKAFGAEIQYIKPRDWKGTIGKPLKGEQYLIEKRLLRMLDEEETKLIYSAKSTKLDHNMVDAVFMGFWAAGRKYKGSAK